MRTIESRWTEVHRTSSGFDYLRIGLAVSIVLWHSYPVSYGLDAALQLWSGGLGYLLQLFLPCFFALSGFLVSASKARTPSLAMFLGLRVIRLFPALAVEILLSALILGPLLTTLALPSFFGDKQFLLYFGNVIGWVHFTLPGVFEYNPIPKIVNSPLWTLPYELESYVALSAIALCAAFQKGWRIILLFLAATIAVASWNICRGIEGATPGGVNGRILVLCFLAGLSIYTYKDEIPYSSRLAALSLIASVFFLRNNYLCYVAPLPAAYFTIYIGLCNPRRNLLVSSGDYSYGTYIYAYPIQQTTALLLGAKNFWILNASISLPVTIAFALLSWHLVEKPFQRFKSVLRGPAKADIRHNNDELSPVSNRATRSVPKTAD